jgi:serine/threonine protein kinase
MCFVAHKGAYLQGILHRDISLNNILITENPSFEGGMLIDWDLCKTSTGVEPGAAHWPSRTVRGVLPSDKYASNYRDTGFTGHLEFHCRRSP